MIYIVGHHVLNVVIIFQKVVIHEMPALVVSFLLSNKIKTIRMFIIKKNSSLWNGECLYT